MIKSWNWKLPSWCIVITISCSPSVNYTKPNTADVISAINISLCTAADSTPEARSVFNLISSGSASTADSIFGGILSGVSVIGKALSCYMKDMATARSQSGEISASRRSDREIMQGRATSCDPSSQAYNLEICKDPRKLSAFLLLKYERANLIKIE